MACFSMRELVLIGTAENVESTADIMLRRASEFLNLIGLAPRLEKTSDVFFGASSQATRKVQLALGVKIELQVEWPGQDWLALGSRNFHRELFTTAFNIGPMHSACVAFGLERILLAALRAIPDHDPEKLLTRLREIAP